MGSVSSHLTPAPLLLSEGLKLTLATKANCACGAQAPKVMQRAPHTGHVCDPECRCSRCWRRQVT